MDPHHRFPCIECGNNVDLHGNAVACTSCFQWCHANAIPGFSDKATQEQLDWKCWFCDPDGYTFKETTDDEASQQIKRMRYEDENDATKRANDIPEGITDASEGAKNVPEGVKDVSEGVKNASEGVSDVFDRAQNIEADTDTNRLSNSTKRPVSRQLFKDDVMPEQNAVSLDTCEDTETDWSSKSCLRSGTSCNRSIPPSGSSGAARNKSFMDYHRRTGKEKQRLDESYTDYLKSSAEENETSDNYDQKEQRKMRTLMNMTPKKQ